MQELFQEVELKMKHGVDHFHDDLRSLRTGRASLLMLDGVLVDYYGSPTPLNQLASLSVPDAAMIVAQPFDPSSIVEIEKAILKADLGLNPSNDGKLVRIPVPALTEDRRKEIVRRAHEMAEAARNVVRQHRREGNDAVKLLEHDKEIGQDEEKRGHAEMQRLHDHYIGDINQSLETKEKDILTV